MSTLLALTLAAPGHLANTTSVLTVILAPFALCHKTKFLTYICVTVIFLSSWSVAHAKTNSGFADSHSYGIHGISGNMVTQNMAEDDTHFLVFDHVGQMASTTTYVHIMLPLNFTAVTEQIRFLNTTMYRFWESKHFYSAHSYYLELAMVAQTDRLLKQLSDRLQKLLDRIDNLQDILPKVEKKERYVRETDAFFPPPPNDLQDSFLSIQHPHLQRHKRWIAAVIVGIVGTLWGLFSAYQINQIATHLTDVTDTQDLLVHLSTEHSKSLKSLAVWVTGISRSLSSFEHINPTIFYTTFSDKVVELEQAVTKLTNIVQQLQHRRLSVDWLDKEQLNTLQRDIDEHTRNKNYIPLTTHHSDYFQLEVSYIRNAEGIVAFLHVPCSQSESVLTIFKYIPFPIPLPHQTNHSSITVAQALHPSLTILQDSTTDFMNKSEALYLVAEADMIAIDSSNKYRLLSNADLAACIQRNHIYLCDKQHVMKTDMAETCIGSLFMKNKGGVRQNCKFEKKPLREEVFPMIGNQFLIYTPEPFVTQAKCANGTIFRAEVSKSTKLTLPEGCSIKLKSHDISMTEQIFLPHQPIVTAWKWDPLTLPADLLADVPHLSYTIDSTFQNLSSALQNQSFVAQDQLAASLSKIDSLSKTLDKVHKKSENSKLTNDGFFHYLNSIFLFSGSTSSIILWTVLALAIALSLGLAFFCYRQKITHKLVKSFQANAITQIHRRPVPSAPPAFAFDTEAQRMYPIIH